MAGVAPICDQPLLAMALTGLPSQLIVVVFLEHPGQTDPSRALQLVPQASDVHLANAHILLQHLPH